MKPSFAKDLNMENYVNLLKKEKELLIENKLLIHEDKSSYLQLLSYGIILSNQWYFYQKHKYMYLLEQYLIGTVGALELKLRFFKMYQQDESDLDCLEQSLEDLLTFPIDDKSDGFDTLMNQLFAVCEVLNDSAEMSCMNQAQFCLAVEDIFSKMKPYCLK